ncbi:MAG: hypothetical protein ACI8W8_003632 [Rhodothermales bacterium]|jgi:hypothetical protein
MKKALATSILFPLSVIYLGQVLQRGHQKKGMNVAVNADGVALWQLQGARR